MGAYDCAKIGKLIGIFTLPLLGQKYDSREVGLQSDDALSIFKNTSVPDLEKPK